MYHSLDGNFGTEPETGLPIRGFLQTGKNALFNVKKWTGGRQIPLLLITSILDS